MYFVFILDCTTTWVNFKTSCYKVFYNNHTNQQKAEMECVKEGGHLISINSEEEMTFIHQFLCTTYEATVDNGIYIGRFFVYKKIDTHQDLVTLFVK